MTDTRTYVHAHLSERDEANSRDVCDAISDLVKEARLYYQPVSFSLDQIAGGLLKIDQTDPDTGVVHAYPSGAARARRLSFLKSLRPGRDLFRAGYKLFGEREGMPVAVVCQWFFDNVAPADGEPLGNMTDTEILTSLPHRDAATAGIVVFPIGSGHGLLLESMKRLKISAAGMMKAHVQAIGVSTYSDTTPKLQRACEAFDKASPSFPDLDAGINATEN